MNAIAEDIRTAILTLLWDDKLEPDPGADADGRPRARPVRQRGAARRRGPVRVRCPPASSPASTTSRSSAWVNPAPGQHVVAGVRLRHRHRTANMFLTVNAGTGAAVRDHHRRRRAAEQRINATAPAAREPVDPPRGHAERARPARLYVNGAPVGTNPNMTLRPSSLGNTTRTGSAARSTATRA